MLAVDVVASSGVGNSTHCDELAMEIDDSCKMSRRKQKINIIY